MLQIVERNKNKEPVYQETLAKMLATKKPSVCLKKKGKLSFLNEGSKKLTVFFFI
jgi:hypothetical protein